MRLAQEIDERTYLFVRPLEHGLARGLIEVQEEWSVVDLFKAHEYLNTRADIEEVAAREKK